METCSKVMETSVELKFLLVSSPQSSARHPARKASPARALAFKTLAPSHNRNYSFTPP